MKIDLVEVEWLDHVSSFDGWHGLKLVKDIRPTQCKSVGYVVFEDKDIINICATVAINNAVDLGDTILSGQTFCIVKSCITKRKVIKKVELTD